MLIQSNSLGEYNPVKLESSHEAASILRHRKNPASMPGISIKPDLPPEERKAESVLLKERRSLINSGVDRSDIKIRGKSLLVGNTRYGCVTNSVFQRDPGISNQVHEDNVETSSVATPTRL